MEFGPIRSGIIDEYRLRSLQGLNVYWFTKEDNRGYKISSFTVCTTEKDFIMKPDKTFKTEVFMRKKFKYQKTKIRVAE